MCLPWIIFSVAIHPDGLYIAAGFGDKIRLLNILIGWFKHHKYGDGDDNDLENIMGLG